MSSTTVMLQRRKSSRAQRNVVAHYEHACPLERLPGRKLLYMSWHPHLVAADCSAVAIARRFSFLFILIVQSRGCEAKRAKAAVQSPHLLAAARPAQAPDTMSPAPKRLPALLRTFGPNATPPPGRSGVRVDP